jgi:hypothetical protein
MPAERFGKRYVDNVNILRLESIPAMLFKNSLRREVELLWRESPALTTTSALMLADFLVTLAGLAFDPRIITGMPAWLKPAKFAISTAIFCASIAWLFRYLSAFPKTKRWTGRALAFILILEVGIIDIQAARGTPSHFNVTTAGNAILFIIMGVSIGILWLLSVWILVALFRQKFKDPTWGWALRLGMLVSVLGTASGGLMTIPTSEQRAAMARHEHVTAAGAHTVGAPDGGPGLPGTGWSTQHGDLRIPHFIGMHALQIIPFLAWWPRKRSTRFVFSMAASYLALYAILCWQALRGESITQPSAATLTVLGVWVAATAGALISLQGGALHER